MNKFYVLAETLGQSLLSRKWILTTAESCTGGGIAQALTAIPGCSQWFDRGFVTYSNAAKIEMLGVTAATIEQYGAVSKETVIAMAIGAINHSHADLAVAVSGIAGPEGGSDLKPVGLVWFAVAGAGLFTREYQEIFPGDRNAVQDAAIEFGLTVLIEACRQEH